MKLSLAWISDHLTNGTTLQADITQAERIAVQLSQSTAEIDTVEYITLNPDHFTLALCTAITPQGEEYFSAETGCSYHLAREELATPPLLNESYLLRLTRNGVRRAYTGDLRTSGESHEYRSSALVPALAVPEDERSGRWKSRCTWQDARLTIDNKAITHRPDLWCHRGFAREIAALIGDTLQPLPSGMLAVDDSAPPTTSAACDRFATVRIELPSYLASSPEYTFRLARMESRPINAIIDLTNYVMFDIGQPLHAYDAQKIQGSIGARQARQGESLVLLDGSSYTLLPNDCVIADAQGAVALAGIMGGAATSITMESRTLLLEAAHFTPYSIRASSQTHRLRTEASTRFEKGLDPATVIEGCMRYVQLLTSLCPQITFQRLNHWQSSELAAATPRTLESSQEALSAIIGIPLATEQITTSLTALGYTVIPSAATTAPARVITQYQITIPSWRAADVDGAEAVAEDIIRLIGYSTIPAELPVRIMQPLTHRQTERLRALKQQLAYGAHMQEISSYPFYDERWLQHLQVPVEGAAKLRNPLSEYTYRLVTSLIPALLKAVDDNSVHHTALRFFEIAQTWQIAPDSTIRESKKLAGILTTRPDMIPFHEGKAALISLFDLLRIPVTWSPCPQPPALWWDPAATAALTYKGIFLGYAGYLRCPGMPLRSFGFELEAEQLLSYIPPLPCYQEPSKFPSTTHDISLLVPNALTAAQLIEQIYAVNPCISSVRLVDSFIDPSWEAQRALTFRIIGNNPIRTMVREEIEALMEQIIDAVHALGVTIR